MSADFIEDIEVADAIDTAMSALNSKERAVIEKIRSGHSISETARLLDIPKQTASSRKSSALKKMQYMTKKYRTIN